LTGRTQQKARTRNALVEATRAFLAEGVTPTVEEAADAAGISRTTAYRYFPNQRALIAATFPQVAAESLLPDPAPEDPAARLRSVLEAMTTLVLEHEPELRAQLRLSLERGRGEQRDLPFRTGRGAVWIEEALRPLVGRMPAERLRRLVLAIRSAVGVEALVWLTDIAGLSREDAVEVMRWSGSALLRAALAEETGTDGSPA
jgi:AcrR family transcriptional regulator